MSKKRVLPVTYTQVDWDQQVINDEKLAHPLYLLEAGALSFTVKYKPDDWLISPTICAHSDFYYQVIGYAIMAEIRYHFLQKHAETGVVTQEQQTSALNRGGSDPIWYQMAQYRRSDHEMTDDIVSAHVLDVDYSNLWKQFEGQQAFAVITPESPHWIKDYIEQKTRLIKDQPPLPTYTPLIKETQI